MNTILILMDVIGMTAFLAAFYYTWRIIPFAEDSQGYWIIFSFAMVMGFAWSLASAMEGIGTVTPFFNVAKGLLLAIASTDLIIGSILSFVSITRPFD